MQRSVKSRNSDRIPGHRVYHGLEVLRQPRACRRRRSLTPGDLCMGRHCHEGYWKFDACASPSPFNERFRPSTPSARLVGRHGRGTHWIYEVPRTMAQPKPKRIIVGRRCILIQKARDRPATREAERHRGERNRWQRGLRVWRRELTKAAGTFCRCQW